MARRLHYEFRITISNVKGRANESDLNREANHVLISSAYLYGGAHSSRVVHIMNTKRDRLERLVNLAYRRMESLQTKRAMIRHFKLLMALELINTWME